LIRVIHIQYFAVLLAIILFALALASTTTIPVKVVAQPDLNIFPLGSKPYGRTYGEWSSAWWQWSVSVPSDKNPSTVHDTTGKPCSLGQTGGVWFLPASNGGSADITCNIPSDKAILFPVGIGECSNVEYPQYKTEPELRKCAKDQTDKVTSIDATIDGKKIMDLKKYRAQSSMFQMTLPANNIFGTAAGPTKAVSDGYLLVIPKLSPGKHEMRSSVSILDFTSSAPVNFAATTVYHVSVTK
jgi:hypothetical protein